MTPYIAEFVGTFFLIFLGNGINANLNLKDTIGHGAGWIVTTIGWGLAVFVGVFIASKVSGAHINPAVTIGLATAGTFSWDLVPGYIAFQILGAAAGNLAVWITFYQH